MVARFGLEVNFSEKFGLKFRVQYLILKSKLTEITYIICGTNFAIIG